MPELRLAYASQIRDNRRTRRGLVPFVKPRSLPRLLLPCNWLARGEADTEVDI